MLVSAIAVIGLSYGLGYQLDWNRETDRPEEDQEVAEIAAPATIAPIGPVAILPPPPATSVITAPATATIGPAPLPTITSNPRDAQWETMTKERQDGRDVSRSRLDLSQGP